MSLIDYEQLNEEDRPIVEQIEINLKKIEILVCECAKNEDLKKHALIRLFEAGIIAKEAVKRSIIFDSQTDEE